MGPPRDVQPRPWQEEELVAFYNAFHQHGKDWQQVSTACGETHTPEQCEQLWKSMQTFLAMPYNALFLPAFLAMATDLEQKLKDEEQAASGGGSKGKATTADDTSRHVDGRAGAANGQDPDGQHQPDVEDDEIDHGQVDVQDENGGHTAAGANSRPVRSNRGKHPRNVSPVEEEEAASRAGRSTPLKGARAFSSPAGKARGKVVLTDSARKRAGGRKTVDDDKNHQKESDQAVDALMQLAMASSMDAEGSAAADAAAVAGGELADNEEAPAVEVNLDRPGKRRVRPPARLENGLDLSSPTKILVSGTPAKKARMGAGAMSGQAAASTVHPLASMRSPLKPLGTPKAKPIKGGAKAKGGRKASRGRGSDEFDEEDMTDEEMLNANDGLGPAPRSAPRGRPLSRTDMDSMSGMNTMENMPSLDVMLGGDGQAYSYNQATLAALSMGSLQLPGLPGGMNLPSPMPGMGMGGGNSGLANWPGMEHMGGVSGRAPASGSLRLRRRKTPPDRLGLGIAPHLLAAQQQQQQMFKSLLGMGGALGGELPAPPTPAAPTPETILAHTLSSSKVRRWVVCEFMYPALDRPFFMRCELCDLLATLNLGAIGRLTRGEWALLRGAFGTARRLSLVFLREERMKLQALRGHFRQKYDELGLGGEVPPELPKPLRVGQEVTARHPATRQLHDGVILTIKSGSYRVQFNRAELMTEVVCDTDIMPCDPRGNLPTLSSVGPTVILNGRSTAHAGGGHGPQARARTTGTQRAAAASNVPTAGGGGGGYSGPGMTGLIPTGHNPAAGSVTEADNEVVQQVADLLDEKNDVLLQLQKLNQEAQSSAGTQSEAFQMQYTQVVLRLKEVNTTLDERYTKLAPRSQQVASQLVQAGLAVNIGPRMGSGGGGGSGGGASAPSGSGTHLPGMTSGGHMPMGLLQGGGPLAMHSLQGTGLNSALEMGWGGLADMLAASVPGGLPGMGLPPGMGMQPLLSGPDAALFHTQVLVHAANTEARQVVERYRKGPQLVGEREEMDDEAGTPQGEPSVSGARDAGERTGSDAVAGARPAPNQPSLAANGEKVEGLITNCLNVLCTIQRSIADGTSTHVMEAGFDAAIHKLLQQQPQLGGEAPGVTVSTSVAGAKGPNAELYNQITESIRTLKTQLVGAV